jgi:cell wall-associated NlpC family hydrolase
LGFRNNLWAIGLASVVTLAGVSALPASVAAADPIPAPTADPSATPAPTADPSATPAPTADPSATVATVTVTVTATVTATVTVAPVAARPNYRARVLRIALAQRGKRYVRGATGPRAFDCSGLVRFAYRRAGVSGHLGGGHSARGMLYWGRIHGRTSRSNPQIGDVVIYGNGSHAGIYIGNGRVISALNPRQGIRITRLHALGAPFTTFIHTRI